jgi:ABC-type spermidine/putrescine transport system permease subunit I
VDVLSQERPAELRAGVLGLITDKISLMYTEFAAFVGLTYVTLPFCFFILLSIFDGIDKRVLEASADLGAAPLGPSMKCCCR